MAQRSFVDDHGTAWKVWDVQPAWAERRAAERRRAIAAEETGERRVGTDRRVRVETRVRVSPGMEHGWLAFESPAQRRRLAPIPADWLKLPAGDLKALCDRADVAPRRA
jgi:hypothetical protein